MHELILEEEEGDSKLRVYFNQFPPQRDPVDRANPRNECSLAISKSPIAMFAIRR